MKIDELVGKYIELRDKQAQMKAKHDAKMDKIKGVMDMIEAALLKFFDESGQNSANTDAGTAYKSTKTSCTVADKDAFMTYVRAEDAWELTDIRASKTGVAQYRSVNDDIPPGLNWREEVVVHVNRPKNS